MENEIELIKHAAVKTVDGQIFFGKQHADCFMKAHYMKIKMSSKANDQGFMTSFGRYVNRKEGAEIALKAGQIDPRPVQTEDDPFGASDGQVKTNILFSEDLWCPAYNGKHYHCELKGYLLKEVKND